jgi:hypothetical protein
MNAPGIGTEWHAAPESPVVRATTSRDPALAAGALAAEAP